MYFKVFLVFHLTQEQGIIVNVVWIHLFEQVYQF